MKSYCGFYIYLTFSDIGNFSYNLGHISVFLLRNSYIDNFLNLLLLLLIVVVLLLRCLQSYMLFPFVFFFIVVLDGCALWFLQKFLQCVKYIIPEFTLSYCFPFFVEDFQLDLVPFTCSYFNFL
jgi:hypothetical protein